MGAPVVEECTLGRQNVRRTILIISMLLMPVVINYYSPFLIVLGSSEGIVVGSMLFFALLFASSLVFGRAYCSWLCPFSGYMRRSSTQTRSPPIAGARAYLSR